ncbi:nuclear pore complex protein NUP205 isoform X1 [Triticum aestivum]|uniref:nuclear pore complex protein NUP205 isoform X1 n=2 Tax=Triticum aestivum TaxID=4565 RepID=UPI001D00E2FB|nr:nuclear pore complex protein NUP205-like isoform X1 [Triticum aestivum]
MQVLELLEVVQFRCPYTSMKYPQLLSNLRVESKMSQELRTQLSESEKGELKGSFHHMLKWAWRYNKYLEEQAAQLHMLTSWSKIVETFRSKPLSPSLESGLSLFVSSNAARTLWRQRWDLGRRAAGICWTRAITCRATHSDRWWRIRVGIQEVCVVSVIR